MARTLTADLAAYRISLWGEPDPRWRRCLAIAGAIGIATLISVYLVPPQPVEITSVDQVSDRLARLILEETGPPVAPAQPRAPEAIQESAPLVPIYGFGVYALFFLVPLTLRAKRRPRRKIGGR